jgi:SSS family solute:Na+ symporter
MNPVLLGLLAYVLVQFAIGVWASRRIANEKDYILAGRSLGTGLVTFSVFATWFGAEAMLATPAEIYKQGLSGATVDPFGYGVALVIAGALLAGRLWRSGITTFADVFRRRYSPAVEQLVVIMLLPGSIFWAAAQILAFGHVLSSAGSFNLTTAVTIAAVLVAAYSVVGGLMADAVTDFLQGIVVIIGLVVLAAAVAAVVGGVGTGLAQVDPAKLDFFYGGDDDVLRRLEKLAVPICGSLVAVELISRYLGARNATIARNGTIAGGLMYLSLGIIPLFLGLMATVIAGTDPAFKASIGDAEQLVPAMAEKFLPRWYFVVFAGAIISAILSVVHAALHAPAAQLSHNIVVRLLPQLDERGRLWSVRLTVMALSVVAYGLAVSYTHIKELVEIASAFGSAGVLVVALFALFTRIGGPHAAIAAIVSATGVWAAGKFMLDWPAPYLTALATATTAYLAVSAVDRPVLVTSTSASVSPEMTSGLRPEDKSSTVAPQHGVSALETRLVKQGRRGKRRHK